MTDIIRRHPDGSIDFDFYRADATRMRTEAMRGSLTGPWAKAGMLVMLACVTVLSILIGSTVRHDTGLVADRPAASHPIR